MVYKESPLCSRDSGFGCGSVVLLPACLINLLPESFGAPSLCLSHPTTIPSQNMSLWYVDYFELKVIENQQMQEKLTPPSNLKIIRIFHFKYNFHLKIYQEKNLPFPYVTPFAPPRSLITPFPLFSHLLKPHFSVKLPRVCN
jgi:hypothetical protein